MRRRVIGLSLIEIIVVVSIILIVLAILVPVFISAKGAAKRASCGSNMKQIGLALTMYAADHDQLLPPHPNSEVLLQQLEPGMTGKVPTNSDSPRRLFESMAAYVKTDDVWFCPSDPVKGQNTMHRMINHEYSSFHYLMTLNPDNYQWPIRVNLDSLPTHFLLLGDVFGDYSEKEMEYEDQSDHLAETGNVMYRDLSIHKVTVDTTLPIDWG